MAIDHLWFNRLKWFNIGDNAVSVTANNRSYFAYPPQVRFNSKFNGDSAEWITNGTMHAGDSPSEFNVKAGKLADCLGVSDDCYIVEVDSDSDTDTLAVKKSLVTPIWGGSPLAHIWCWFKAVTARLAVIA